MRQQEATVGIEHQLNDVHGGQRPLRPQADRPRDRRHGLARLPDGSEIYVIANPGEGLTALAFTNPGRGAAEGDARLRQRRVRGREAVRRTTGISASSYLWSRLYGNYSGLSQSDENGRTSPNVGRLFDYPVMMFQDGGTPAFGPLATDRPHQFKTQFIYQFPFGTSVGVNQYVASGLPVSREIGIFPANNCRSSTSGREQRRPDADLLADRPAACSTSSGSGEQQPAVQLQRAQPVQPGHGRLEVLDLPEDDGVVARTKRRSIAVQLDFDAADRAAGNRAGSALPEDNGFQAPIPARFGVRFLF